jgi:hypothetical protein
MADEQDPLLVLSQQAGARLRPAKTPACRPE